MASVFDILGVTLGILGLFSAIPILLQWAENQLPMACLQQFDTTVYSTEWLLDQLAQEGTLETQLITAFSGHLASIKHRSRKARLLTYQATTQSLWKQLQDLPSGPADELSGLHSEVVQLRAGISAAAIEAEQTFVPADTTTSPVSRPPARTNTPKPLRSALRNRKNDKASSPPPPYSSAASVASQALAVVRPVRRVKSVPVGLSYVTAEEPVRKKKVVQFDHKTRILQY
ncbi:hypothetical protein BD413DRAFT_615489 [Trametes elegans]|nr:hypothetical protein BD413DRAFT_615489 [Trametes elegans]